VQSGFLIRAYTKATVVLSEKMYALKNDLSLTANSKCHDENTPCVIPELTPLSSHFKVQVVLKG
jgi:hypothetical protein